LCDSKIISFKWIEEIFPNLDSVDVRNVPRDKLKPLLNLNNLTSIWISTGDALSSSITKNPIIWIENIKNYIFPEPFEKTGSEENTYKKHRSKRRRYWKKWKTIN
jgi:hypothetical protein